MKGFEYRFAVGSKESYRSSSYSIFTNPKKSDIYLGHRGIIADHKVSIHESGQNRIAYTSNSKHHIAIQRTKENSTRLLHKWTGVTMPYLEGYKIHFKIVIPTSDLRIF